MFACRFKAVPCLADPVVRHRRIGGRFQGHRDFTAA